MNKARKIGLIIVLGIPLIYRQLGGVVADLRETQEAFFGYLIICLAGLFIGNIWLGAFLILNVLLYLLNGQQVGADQVLNILFGCLLFAFSRTFFRRNKFSDLYPWLLALLAINLIWMNLQLWSIDPIFVGMRNDGQIMFRPFNDPVGFFGIKMANGIFITSMMAIVAAANPILSIALLIPLWLMRSSAVALAILVATLFYTYHLYRKVFIWLAIALPILAGAYIAYDINDDPKTAASRFPVWHSAARYVFASPESLWGLVGYGPDSYRNFTIRKTFQFAGDEFYNHGLIHKVGNDVGFSYYSATNDSSKIDNLTKNIGNTKVAQGQVDAWDNPHSEIIQVLFQYGLIGITLLFMLVREMIQRFRYTIKDKELVTITTCLIVYAIVSLIHFPFELARLATFAMVCLGAFYAKTDQMDNGYAA